MTAVREALAEDEEGDGSEAGPSGRTWTGPAEEDPTYKCVPRCRHHLHCMLRGVCVEGSEGRGRRSREWRRGCVVARPPVTALAPPPSTSLLPAVLPFLVAIE